MRSTRISHVSGDGPPLCSPTRPLIQNLDHKLNNSVHLIFTLSGYRRVPHRHVTGGRGTRVHKCIGPCYGSSHFCLAKLLGGTWSVCPPRRVAQRVLVDPSASQGFSVGLSRPVRLVGLLSGTWLAYLPCRVARRDLVGSFASQSCSMGAGRLLLLWLFA
jgi:hypothetical protein